MRTRQRMSDQEPCSFPRQLKKPLGRLWALSNRNAGENAIKIALRPGANPGIHLLFSQAPGKFSPPFTNPLPNRIGKRDMFALYSFVDQGVEFAGVRRFVGPQNEQFPAAGNDRRMALKGGVGQPAKGALCFAETASLHVRAKNRLYMDYCQNEIIDAAEKRDFQRLDSYHLYGPKFTKFETQAPGRLDAEAARKGEHDGLGAATDVAMRADDLKIDVFSP